jgi:Pentapeptide repeats (8 copies)
LLVDADLYRAEMSGAVLGQAGLTRANLSSANLTNAYLERAYLVEANLSRTKLAKAKLAGAVLEPFCKTYGAFVWKVNLTRAQQLYLQITPGGESPLSIDCMEAAQIIYLLMDNKKIDELIPILSKKAVLLLGRFTEGRKEILDMIRTELRKLEWLATVFDFERPSSRNLTETVTLLVGWSRFIISDLTKPRSNPLELQQIIPQWKIPLLPIIQEGENEFAMFRDLFQYPWVAPTVTYKDTDGLCRVLKSSVIDVGVRMSQELEAKKSSHFG